MSTANERGNIEIHGQVTYSSEIFPFLFWEIEGQTYPKRKITIRRRHNLEGI
jgi:hypothetical protein